MKDKKNKIEYELKLQEKDDKYLDDKEYDFIARLNHLVSTEEQKVKVEEIEDITEKEK